MSKPEQRPDILSRETILRFAREWENKPEGEAFSMRARITEEGNDVIEKIHFSSSEEYPEGFPQRQRQDNLRESMYLHGEVIFEHEMDDDL